jgi:fucose 4-O-acetylase-like acetyltransferase
VFELIVAVFGFLLVASVVLAVRAMLSSSWVVMWIAALASLVVCMLLIFSFGALLFLPTCLQIAAAFSMRHRASTREWLLVTLVAVLVWIVVVPLQYVLGAEWTPGFGVLAPVGAVGLILVLVPPTRFRRLSA